jgi:transposase
MDFGIIRMIWPGKSPDLNMIEPAWFHLKKITTRRRALNTRTEATAAWIQAWEELEQWRINDWIRKIRGRV